MNPKIEELEKRLAEIKDELILLKMRPASDKYPVSRWIQKWRDTTLADYENTQFSLFGLNFSKDYMMFAALVETCNEWNSIDEYKPKYDDTRTVIKNFNDTVFISTGLVNGALMFRDYQTAQLFHDTYRTELEQVKHLL
jgi:hypothetical protein